jgi:hypothetical protein
MFIIVVYTFYSQMGYDPVGALTVSIYYLVLLIPTVWIHIEYYQLNKNDVFVINSTERIISSNAQGDIHFDQIEKIVFVLSPEMYRNSSFRALPVDNYGYAVIKIKDGSDLIFTTLLAYRIEEVFNGFTGVRIERKKQFIASPLLHKYWSVIWD